MQNGEVSRGGRIRTGDLLFPEQALYQAEPRPVIRCCRRREPSAGVEPARYRLEDGRLSVRPRGHS